MGVDEPAQQQFDLRVGLSGAGRDDPACGLRAAARGRSCLTRLGRGLGDELALDRSCHRQLVGDAQRHRPHLRVVLDRQPDVPERVLEVSRDRRGLARCELGDLEMRPRLGDHIGVAADIGLVRLHRADDLAQSSREVAPHRELRMHDELRIDVMGVERQRDRVDQERHVVGDHVDHVAVGQQRGVGARPDLNDGATLRPEARELSVRERDLADPLGSRGDQVRGVDVPVVGVQVALVVANLRGGAPSPICAAASARSACRAALWCSDIWPTPSWFSYSLSRSSQSNG